MTIKEPAFSHMTENPKDTHGGHLWIKDLRDGDRVAGRYLARDKRMGTTQRGDPFLTIVLTDRTGEVEAKVWEEAGRLSALFHPGDILEVDGSVGSYRGRVQVTVSGLKVFDGEADPATFLETASRDASEMMASLRQILKEVKNPHLKSLTDRILSDKGIISLFKKAPAAKNFHHNYLGGLLEHTLSVCQMTLKVTEHYPHLDKDLLLTAAFLHDIGKIRELRSDSQIDYTDEGRLLGHLVLGVETVDDTLRGFRGFPEELLMRLKHLILSHHGQFEFGSPKRPKFLEAFALHLIDDLDAKINGLGRFMERDRREGAWTEFNRLFERYFLKRGIIPVEEEQEERGRQDERQGMLFSP